MGSYEMFVSGVALTLTILGILTPKTGLKNLRVGTTEIFHPLLDEYDKTRTKIIIERKYMN